jgi:hypothetical protein
MKLDIVIGEKGVATSFRSRIQGFAEANVGNDVLGQGRERFPDGRTETKRI